MCLDAVNACEDASRAPQPSSVHRAPAVTAFPRSFEPESAQLESLVTYVPIAKAGFVVAHGMLLVFTNTIYVELHFILNYQLFTLWMEAITIFIL